MNSGRLVIVTFVGAMALAGASGIPLAGQRQDPQSPAPPPSEAEIRERSAKLVQNQHADDAALEQFERIERQVEQTAGNTPRILSEKVFRVVPFGAGYVRLLLKAEGKPVDAAEYERQLLAWRDLLQLALRPDDSKFRSIAAKWDKKKRDRAELVDGARDAFLVKWLGRETRNGRLCDVLDLTPNPSFRPHSTFQDALTHVTAKAWVDPATNQLARGEVHVTRDMSFGGGILGKLYRGGVFSLEQDEVAPGIWLPTRYQYDFTARKFLFTFEQHQYIEASRYRKLGSPKEILEVVHNELATGKTVVADP